MTNFFRQLFRYSNFCCEHSSFVATMSQKCSRVHNLRLKSLFADILLGVLIYALLISHQNTLNDALFLWTDHFIAWLKSIIGWLMGNPAGLKLNQPLNTMMGNFFLYHIYLWETYLTFVTPLISHCLSFVKFLALFGASLALAISVDLLALLTMHVFCFHVYAARLYQLELKCLVSFMHFFRGKKYNPLRKRVDSTNYDPQQLFLGTLIFTILIFLLPTILTYYCVFTFLRLLRYMVLCLGRFFVIDRKMRLNVVKFTKSLILMVARGQLYIE